MSAAESLTSTDLATAEVVRAPGDVFWSASDTGLKPLLIRQGVVAYRSGQVAIGLLGPGQIVLPTPGVAGETRAAADLVAITETTVIELDPADHPLSQDDLKASALAVVSMADRLGNLSLPQRLAALLLDITDLNGHPVVGCRQDILAMAAAARRETVATILSAWRDEDWIQTRYRRCKVMDRGALQRIKDGLA